MAVPPLASTSSLPTLALPAYSPATTSIVGAICRHGPHHSAQKSTKTGTSDRSTSGSNVASEKLNVFSPAISSPDFNLLESQGGHKIQRANNRRYRSEEHTSELQSRQYLVCRLLLEK